MSQSRKVRRGEEGYHALTSHRKSMRRRGRTRKAVSLEAADENVTAARESCTREALDWLDSLEQCWESLKLAAPSATAPGLLTEAVAKTEKSLAEIRELMDSALGAVAETSSAAASRLDAHLAKEWNSECQALLTSIPGQTRGTFVGEATARVYLDEEGIATSNATNVRHDFRISLDSETWAALDAKISVGETRAGKSRWQFFHLDPDKSEMFFLIGASVNEVSGWLVPSTVLETILEHKGDLDTEGLVVCREDNDKYRGNLAVKITVDSSPVLLEPYKVKGAKLAELLVNMLHVYSAQ